jgi:hypothetical protein
MHNIRRKTYEKPVLVKTGVLPQITAQENAAGRLSLLG